ncbi:MAG: sigma-70 family RNA polymerase sigma factor [Bacteroidota bacterium]|nr:sigma-70 family RNA polymerase sigma factor [Bacteroidota bacterium]
MLSQNSTDQYLVEGYLAGNHASFERLLTRHKNRVYAFIMSKIKNRDITEDIFQDTFIKVINSLKTGKYNEEGKFLPWVMRIAHNLVIDHFRRNKKMSVLRSTEEFDIFDVIPQDSLNQEEEMIIEQTHANLKSLIDKLPNDQKEVLQLRYYEDMSFKEIAKLTDVSINTALGRMRYALINLRKISNEKNIDLQIK